MEAELLALRSQLAQQQAELLKLRTPSQPETQGFLSEPVPAHDNDGEIAALQKAIAASRCEAATSMYTQRLRSLQESKYAAVEPQVRVAKLSKLIASKRERLESARGQHKERMLALQAALEHEAQQHEAFVRTQTATLEYFDEQLRKAQDAVAPRPPEPAQTATLLHSVVQQNNAMAAGLNSLLQLCQSASSSPDTAENPLVKQLMGILQASQLTYAAVAAPQTPVMVPASPVQQHVELSPTSPADRPMSGTLTPLATAEGAEEEGDDVLDELDLRHGLQEHLGSSFGPVQGSSQAAARSQPYENQAAPVAPATPARPSQSMTPFRQTSALSTSA